MCGIVGVFNWKTGKSVKAETLSAMLNSIKHRGPDQTDFLVDREDSLPQEREI